MREKVHKDAAHRVGITEPAKKASKSDAMFSRMPYKATVDSDMVTNYQPAQHVKPSSFFTKIQSAWDKYFKHTPAEETTQQGSQAASPSAYSYELYSLRYERRGVISDCRMMYDNDPRVRRSINMFVREAVRKGVFITVQNGARGLAGQKARIAQEMFCSNVERILNNKDEGNPKVESFGRMALVEGDLFQQFVIAPEDEEMIDIMRMPAASMERNTDDADKFIDTSRAFSNVDVLTNAEIATFSLATIWHGRWCHVDGDKYGNPEIVAARRLYRLLELAEEAQLRRRISRAPQRILWNVGTPTNPGMPDDVLNWKEAIGEVEGLQEQYDPVNVGWNYYGNGLVTANVIKGDQTVHEIDDVRYFQDEFVNAGLPTPAAIYALASKEVNRDVLEDVKAQWLLETATLTEFLAGGVRRAVDLGLMLKGILPESVDIIIHFSESSIETPKDIIDRACLLLNNGFGQGLSFTWMPLITWQRAITMISEFADIDDAAAEFLLVNEMQKKQMANVPQPSLASPGSSPSSVPASASTSASKSNMAKTLPKNSAKISKAAKDDATLNSSIKNFPPKKGSVNNIEEYLGIIYETQGGGFAGNGTPAAPYYSVYGEPETGLNGEG